MDVLNKDTEFHKNKIIFSNYNIIISVISHKSVDKMNIDINTQMIIFSFLIYLGLHQL